MTCGETACMTRAALGVCGTYNCRCPASGEGFPGSSADKESAHNAGDPSLTPGLGRAPGEGISYPLQYSWASLAAQTVKNLSAMWATWVKSLGWENSMEEGMATHSRILARRIPMDREVWWVTVFVISESDTTERLSTARVFLFPSYCYCVAISFSNA